MGLLWNVGSWDDVLSSLKLSAKNMMGELRKQWAIENGLHWVLDVSLGEDGNKTRHRVASNNLAVVRKIALNLVKQDKTSKVGVKSKLKRAGWDNRYLEEILLNPISTELRSNSFKDLQLQYRRRRHGKRIKTTLTINSRAITIWYGSYSYN